jgi:hypothetical protein
MVVADSFAFPQGSVVVFDRGYSRYAWHKQLTERGIFCGKGERFIFQAILKALRGEPIPVYGGTRNVRAWRYVDDHVRALLAVLLQGILGETYSIGGHNEKKTWAWCTPFVTPCRYWCRGKTDITGNYNLCKSPAGGTIFVILSMIRGPQ